MVSRVGGGGLRVARLLVGELVLLGLFYFSAPVLGTVPFSRFQEWLRTSDPQTAFTALVRVGGLVVSAWLVVSTLLYLLGRIAGLRGVARCSSWVTLPVLRRVIDGVAAASLLATTVGAAAGVASAAPMPVPVRTTAVVTSPLSTSSAVVSAFADTTGPTAAPQPVARAEVNRRVVGRHLPHPGIARHVLPARELAALDPAAPSADNGFAGLAPGTKVVVVKAGDCLSTIAQAHLDSWRDFYEISALNRGRVQPDGHALEDDHWIYPGWVLVMPASATGAIVVGSATVPSSAPAGGSTPGGAAPPVVQPTVPAQPSAPLLAPASPASNGAAGPSVPARVDDPPITAPSPTTTTTVTTTSPAANGSTRRSPISRTGGERDGSRVTLRSVPSGAPASTGTARSHQSHQPTAGTRAPLIPAAGIGSLVAAGVVWRLARRRREQMLARPRGAPVPVLPAAVEEVERRARAIADGEALAWIHAGLRYLGRLLRDFPDPPSVVLVRAGAVGLEVMVDRPNLEPPGRFWLADDGVAWVLQGDIDLPELEDLAADGWPLLPALVTVGETEAGTVLANLEHAGSLAVAGDGRRCRALLLQMLVELTSYPWTDQTLAGVHVLGNAGLAEPLAGVDVDDDPMYLAQILDRVADGFQDQIWGARSVAARRASDSGWEPHVTVAFGDAPSNALRCCLEAAVPDRSGVAVVCAGAAADARWCLDIDAAGNALLTASAGERPFQMELRVDPDVDAMGLLAADLAFAATPTGIGLEDRDDQVAAVAATARRGEREVVVLGPVSVAGDAGLEAVESKRRRPGLAVLAYLATHTQPVSSALLERALWPLDETKPKFGGVAASTLNNVVTNARKILGRGPNGEDLLLFQPGLGYSLHPLVTVDWVRFQQEVASAMAAEDTSRKVARWRAALTLLETVPFQGFYPGRFFEWVGSERLAEKMAARVVDAAQDLGTAALDLGDWDTVKWAVGKGLTVDPVREELFQLAMHAEGRAGRPDLVEELYGDLCAMLAREIDPLQTPSDESDAVWKRYTSPLVGGRRTAARR